MDANSQKIENDLLNLGVRHVGRTEKRKRQVRILDTKIVPPSFCTFANTELMLRRQLIPPGRILLGHVKYAFASTNSARNRILGLVIAATTSRNPKKLQSFCFLHHWNTQPHFFIHYNGYVSVTEFCSSQFIVWTIFSISPRLFLSFITAGIGLRSLEAFVRKRLESGFPIQFIRNSSRSAWIASICSAPS